MVEQEVEEMIEQVASKYALVVAVARRARQFVAGEDPDWRDRPVSRALAEAAILSREGRSLESAWAGDGYDEGWTEPA